MPIWSGWSSCGRGCRGTFAGNCCGSRLRLPARRRALLHDNPRPWGCSGSGLPYRALQGSPRRSRLRGSAPWTQKSRHQKKEYQKNGLTSEERKLETEKPDFRATIKAVTNSRYVGVLRRAGGGVPTRADTVITSRLKIPAVSPLIRSLNAPTKETRKAKKCRAIAGGQTGPVA